MYEYKCIHKQEQVNKYTVAAHTTLPIKVADNTLCYAIHIATIQIIEPLFIFAHK